MEWLTQNWIWIVLVVGVFFMMRRGGMGCGVGGHRSHHGGHSEGHGDGHSDGAPRLESAIDAVSGQAVGVEKALTSVYRGRTYYFATRENRDTFEAAPERYASAAGSEHEHRRNRHGCC